MTRRAELMAELTVWVLAHANEEQAHAFQETLRLADEAEQLRSRDEVRAHLLDG